MENKSCPSCKSENISSCFIPNTGIMVKGHQGVQGLNFCADCGVLFIKKVSLIKMKDKNEELTK